MQMRRTGIRNHLGAMYKVISDRNGYSRIVAEAPGLKEAVEAKIEYLIRIGSDVITPDGFYQGADGSLEKVTITSREDIWN